MGGKSSKPKVDKKKIPALSEEEVNKLIANSNFTRDEIIALHKDFMRDTPSGKINSKEFAKKFKSAHMFGKIKAKPEKYCEVAFNAFDKNHDGFIDFNEFVVGFSVITSGDLNQKVNFAFRHYDADRDEKINKTDLLKVVTSQFQNVFYYIIFFICFLNSIKGLYDLNGIPEVARKKNNDPKKRVDDAMKKLDVNKKNEVTITEFVEACLNDQELREFLVDPLYSK